jgi:PhzF family phenazine biosynthesis protein
VSKQQLHHLAAFATGDTGGNPAGVWIGDELPSPAEMQRIAFDVGASETAFVAPATGERRKIRYYSPEVEVSFCGHATIATGVVLGREHGEGSYVFDTRAGKVVVTAHRRGRQMQASLESVATRQQPIADAELQQALDCLHWSCDELDSSLPPVNSYAGAWHYVIAVAERSVLDALDYDFDALKALMQCEGLTTLQLLWRESDTCWHARNPFPIGGVIEDPATGAAAAALGGYLRDAGLITTPYEFDIRQGEVMGMPSLIRVHVPEDGGIVVSGTARDL